MNNPTDTTPSVATFTAADLSVLLSDSGGNGQHRADGLEVWPNVPYLDEHPFLAPQTRWVLANCGIIDPSSTDEYLARGGYRALAKALGEMTPAELCETVERSGLGLAILKRILPLYEGDVSVESEPDAGTTFTGQLERNVLVEPAVLPVGH